MSNAKTTYLSHALLNHVLRNTNYTRPTTVYLALYTVAPTSAGGGTEVAGGSYARQAITFGAPSGEQTTNTSTVTFSSMPTATVVAVGICDALTVGNLLYFQTLSPSTATVSGDDLVYTSGNIAVTEN